MHALVNASLGAIGNRDDINDDWPAVHWLVTHWQSLFGAPGDDEQSLGDPTGLQWADYLYGIYILAARQVGPGGNWADPANLTTARDSIRGFAKDHPPSSSAPVATCGTSINHVNAALNFAVDAAPPFNTAPPKVPAGGTFALKRDGRSKGRKHVRRGRG